MKVIEVQANLWYPAVEFFRPPDPLPTIPFLRESVDLDEEIEIITLRMFRGQYEGRPVLGVYTKLLDTLFIHRLDKIKR